VKRDGHRPSYILVTGRCDEADEPASATRFPVAEHPVRRFKNTMRWQVSRLAEQDFSSDPRLPDLSVSGQLGISPVTVAGAAAFEPATL
jgi:hypothetical protein